MLAEVSAQNCEPYETVISFFPLLRNSEISAIAARKASSISVERLPWFRIIVAGWS